MDHIHLKHHILIHEIRRSLSICLYTAHLCRRQKHIRRLFLGKKRLNGILPTKIELRVGARHNMRIALSFQLAANR